MSDTDLTITRVIGATPLSVWHVWTTPELFEQWWAPAPVTTRVLALDVRPGGSLHTEMQLANGDLIRSHGCFLAATKAERVVYTDALSGGWRPAKDPFFTAIVDLAEVNEGTEYRVTVLHADPADRRRHEEMGFFEGWGKSLDQLAALAENL